MRKKVTVFPITIKSDNTIDTRDVKKIVDIFKESNCPNESMFFSIPRFRSFDEVNRVVRIGNGDKFSQIVNIGVIED